MLYLFKFEAMNKFYLPFIKVSLLAIIASCHLMQKRPMKKTKASDRITAAIDPRPFLKNNSATSNKISDVLVIRDKKLVCAFSAVKWPKLIPSDFQPVLGNLQLSLPQCSQEDLNTALYITQNSVFLDEKGEYQQSALPLIVPFYSCLAGSLIGVFIATPITEQRKKVKPTKNYAGIASLLTMLSSFGVVSTSLPAVGQITAIRLAGVITGITGACGSLTAGLIFLDED